jgi:hypothetical protein
VLAALSPERRADLERALAVLADTSYSVTILPDGDHAMPETGLGYRVTMNAPGFHAVARLRVDATATEWAATLAALRPTRVP